MFISMACEQSYNCEKFNIEKEHDQTNIDSVAVTRSDSETKSIKPEKDHPGKEHASIEHNLKPSTRTLNEQNAYSRSFFLL